MTKKDVIQWLNKQHEKYAGMFMDAEEDCDDVKMAKASTKTDTIEEIISLLETL